MIYFLENEEEHFEVGGFTGLVLRVWRGGLKGLKGLKGLAVWSWEMSTLRSERLRDEHKHETEPWHSPG